MTQQVFADFIGSNPATLSGIFNARTHPTLNIVEAIKKKIPDISTDWLMFGIGQMYQQSPASSADIQTVQTVQSAPNNLGQTRVTGSEQILDFGPVSSSTPQSGAASPASHNSVKSTHQMMAREEVKYFDKPQRRVTEIRVYYDDQTWESFVPSKK